MSQIFSATIKGIDKAFKKFEGEQNVATSRTLNIQAARALKIVSKEIKDETGIKQSTIKRAIKIKKATKFNAVITWTMKGARLTLSKVRQLKRGISFTGRGKKRKKIVDAIGSGSKPFVIKGSNSGKNVGVYRKPGQRKTVTTLKGSSIPHLFGIVGVDLKRFQELIFKGIAKEYSKQLKRAGFRGKRR